MKNLFDYATKELSQDAFLRWLFENYNEFELKKIVYNLAKEFCDFSENEQIQSISTKAQQRYIDISVYIDTNFNKYALFIEDKVYSSEHEQLENYNKEIERLKANRLVKKIFYKTSRILEDEKNRVYNLAGWKSYDLQLIYSLFKDYKDTTNQILSQYIEHLEKMAKANIYMLKPNSNDNWEDLLKWESYFHLIADELLKNYLSGGIWKAGRFPYMCLVFRKNRFYPYLEIRSKDCLNDNFEAVILCYGLKDKGSPFETEQEITEKQVLLKNEIAKSGFFTEKYCRKNPKGFTKQLGRYISNKKIMTNEDFINEIKKCLFHYDKLIDLWNSEY